VGAGLWLLTILVLFLGFVPLAAGQSWTLIWSDEFDGPAGPPDASNWKFETGNNNGWGNAELEFYCPPGNSTSPCSAAIPNAQLDGNGNLVIQAIKTPSGTWTSARMKTQGLHEFQYGRIEARMKLPLGAGLWPAFWMLGTNIGSAGWPTCGEQDIMEWVPQYTPVTTSSTVHGPGYSGGSGIGSRFTLPSGGRVDDAGFHTYGVIWSQNQMQFYRDDSTQPFFAVTPANLPAGKQWVFNHPFFILLNLAVGGNFPGPPSSSTPSPATVLVDYVRVFEQSPTVTVSSSGNPSVVGQSVTFTATLVPASATGTVQFKDGSTNLGGAAAVVNGSATFSTSSLSVGVHNITANYSGDSNFAGSVGMLPTQTVNPAHSSASVSSSPNPSVFGQPVVLTTTVSAVAPGVGTLTGTVQLKDGTTNLGGAVAVSNGSAMFSTSSLAVGQHNITADYSGDRNFTASSGALPVETVSAAGSSTLLSSTGNRSVAGAPVTFTATVAPVEATGTVTFQDGSVAINTSSLSGGISTFSTSTLAPGPHSITASYDGDISFASSTSSVLAQAIMAQGSADSQTTLVASPGPILFRQQASFSVSVSSTSTPAGSVILLDGDTQLGPPLALNEGIAATQIPLPIGMHSIRAVYQGTADFSGSYSSVQKVNASPWPKPKPQ
jgi:beta-glucanase (GH16 family)